MTKEKIELEINVDTISKEALADINKEIIRFLQENSRYPMKVDAWIKKKK